MSLSLAGSGEITGFDAVASGFGGLVAVKSAIFTGTQSVSVAGNGNAAITNLSITHEVADPANRLIISAFIGALAQNIAGMGMAVHDGTDLIAIADVSGSRPRTMVGGQIAASVQSYTVTQPSGTFVHTPGAGSKTYTLRVINVSSTTQTLFINRESRDGAADPRTVSSLVIQEVKV
jgi:hypothetical protein